MNVSLKTWTDAWLSAMESGLTSAAAEKVADAAAFNKQTTPTQSGQHAFEVAMGMHGYAGSAAEKEDRQA